MTVLMLFSHKWRFGGAETYVTLLAEQLHKRGHKIILITDKFCDDGRKIPDGIEHCILNFKTLNPLSIYQTFAILKKITEEHKVDIIHAQQRTAGYYAAMLRRITGIPFVVTLHDIWRRAPFKALHGRLFPHIIAVSEFIRTNYISNFSANPDSVKTIFNGVEETKYHDYGALHIRAEEMRSDFGIAKDAKVVALVGRVTRAKGHYDFIEAIKRVKDIQIPFSALVVGDGPDKQELESITERFSLKDIIKFAGYQTDIPAIMTLADIVVLPSYREAFGLTLVEAMLARRPVVASKVGGIPEIVFPYENGLLIEPGNIKQLADSLARLLKEDEERKRMGLNGYRFAIEKATLSCMVNQTEGFYGQIISSAPLKEVHNV